MEDTLRDERSPDKFNFKTCLNPCFNGRYSQRSRHNLDKQYIDCLNPCFNGRYSQRAKTCVPLFIVV